MHQQGYALTNMVLRPGRYDTNQYSRMHGVQGRLARFAEMYYPLGAGAISGKATA